MMTTRADIVATARTQLGVRWLHQATLWDVALDCIGLVGGTGVARGLPDAMAWSRDPAVKGYSRKPDAAVLTAACRKYLDEIPIAQAGIGDILVFALDVEPQHFAIITGVDPLRIIHSYAAVRKVSEHGIDGEWKHGKTWRSMIDSAWRFRGVTD